MEFDSHGIGNYYEGSYEKQDKNFNGALDALRLKLKKAPKINPMERKILEFCHNRDMKEFLREEFEKHPIRLDPDGNLIGENPFDKERRERGDMNTYQGVDPLYESIGIIQATTPEN